MSGGYLAANLGFWMGKIGHERKFVLPVDQSFEWPVESDCRRW